MALIEKLFGSSNPPSSLSNAPIRSTGSAAIARERLQIILAHERSDSCQSTPDYLPALQKELMQVVSKYVNVSENDIKVQFEHQGKYEVLEVNIVLPER